MRSTPFCTVNQLRMRAGFRNCYTTFASYYLPPLYFDIQYTQEVVQLYDAALVRDTTQQRDIHYVNQN